MEDAHVNTSIPLPTGETGMLFGIFDGHGGARVAKFAASHIKQLIMEQKEFKV